MFCCKNVSFRQKNISVLENVSFSVPNKPSITTIIGPNGAGKSTLLHLLAGLLKPTQGIIERPFARVGYMPQYINIHPALPLTAEDFLNLTPQSKQTGASLLKMLYPKDNFAKKQLRVLSMGERQRALFAKALMPDPDVLLLDEPTQGLDLYYEDLFYKHIKEQVKRKRTVIMASHDLHVVFKESAYILCLNKRVLCAGEPKAVQSNPSLREAWQKAMPRTLKPYRHTHA